MIGLGHRKKQRFVFSLHARKFATVNNLKWKPVANSLVPPLTCLTNENMEEFFVQCWEDGSKPNVTQGHRYINHALTHHKRPPLNRHHRQEYASVLDVLKGLEKEDAWRDHMSQGAKPLSKDNVKKLLLANIRNADGKINVRKLRNKALASLLILCGWHPKDAWRIKDENVICLEDFRDSDGHLRPKFLFNDLCHNKLRMLKVFNTIGCGCKGSHHPKNDDCPFNLLKWYQDLKESFDESLMDKKKNLSRLERRRHFDERGNLNDRKFFRSITKEGGCGEHFKKNTVYPTPHQHRNMGIGAIRAVFEWWRPILDLGPDPLTTDMARKTFVTFGVKYTGRENKHRPGALQDPRRPAHGGHPSPVTGAVPVLRRELGVARSDRNTESDPEAEAHPARTFSLWASGHHKPPVTSNVPDALGRMKDSHDSAFGSLQKVQGMINQNNLVDPQGDPGHSD